MSIFPVIVVLFVLMNDNSLTIPFTPIPLTLKYFTVVARKLARSVFEILFVKALKFRVVRPYVNSMSMHFAIQEVPFVSLTIFVQSFSFSVHVVVLESPLICESWSEIFPIPMFCAVQILTFVSDYLIISSPGLSSVPIWKVSSPITLKFNTIFFEYKLPLTFSLLIFKFTFIIPTVIADKSAFSVWNSIFKIAYVIATIRIKQLSSTMRHAIFPLAILAIYKTFFI